MATAYYTWSTYGGPYYRYQLDVEAPSSRTGTSVTFSYKFWAQLESGGWDGDGKIWYDIGGKEGGDTTDWKYWYSCGNVNFRTGTWNTTDWHGPWTGNVTVNNLGNTTTSIRIRLWVNRERGDAGKIDKRDYILSIPARTSYTVSYNANGGTDAPDDQIKWHGSDITLSNIKPTRADEDKNGYVVSFNTNGGEVEEQTITAVDTYSYTFSKWNTSSSGSGTNYTSGATYSSNASATLYAVWNSSKSNGKITLPTPTRSGFTFLGWSESVSDTTNLYQSDDEYTPSSNITLYAIWRANLTGSYVLKTTMPDVTWEKLLADQANPGSTLYEVGGQYNGWSVDNAGYVTCFGKRITIDRLNYIRKTGTIASGVNYYYYTGDN